MNIEQLYADTFRHSATEVIKLPGSGSNRSYYRIGKDSVVIGCDGKDGDENRAFIYLARHFRNRGLNVPQIYAVSEDYSLYLQEDLGDMSLFDYISSGREQGEWDDSQKEMLKKTMNQLARIQFTGAKGLDFTKCYPSESFDQRMVSWDLNYFKYCFLKPSGIEFNESHLEDDFNKLSQDLINCCDTDTFMYRDFQSRNVMVRNNEPWFIDFQGGRRGPIYYDVASFLWQARAKFPQWLRDEMLVHYIKCAKEYISINTDDFYGKLNVFILFRQLQVLGAYGFRGLIERKSHFIVSIPPAINNLKELIDRGVVNKYPYLKNVLSQVCDIKHLNKSSEHKKLIVKVISFSYKKGVPQDYSGNGGGFVFDCRALHNPGRYDEYKQLTGRDSAVIKFLEGHSDVNKFLENVYDLCGASVEKYLSRGFTNLMICFGCTGGQHRSVFCAESTARYLHEKYGVTVELIHREQNIREELM